MPDTWLCIRKARMAETATPPRGEQPRLRRPDDLEMLLNRLHETSARRRRTSSAIHRYLIQANIFVPPWTRGDGFLCDPDLTDKSALALVRSDLLTDADKCAQVYLNDAEAMTASRMGAVLHMFSPDMWKLLKNAPAVLDGWVEDPVLVMLGRISGSITRIALRRGGRGAVVELAALVEAFEHAAVDRTLTMTILAENGMRTEMGWSERVARQLQPNKGTPALAGAE